MPKITFFQEIDIKTFVNSCDDNDIHDLIDYLFEIGHLKKNLNFESISDELKKMSSEEIKFEEALNRMKGGFSKMTYLDTTIIIELSKKFK